MRTAGLVMGCLLLAIGAAQAQLAVGERNIVRKTGKLHLDIRYPQTGVAAIDRLLDRRGMAKMDAEDLRDATPKWPSYVGVSYAIKRNDAQMFSVEIDSSVYRSGAAHGVPEIVTYNFLMSEGTLIGLSDLVTGQRGLERVRGLVSAELERKLPGIAINLKAREGWFSNFVWQPGELEVTYAPYEVAGYAQGTQIVHIPMAKLAGVIRPDPRAPAPSFDCALAHSRIDKAICSDAELARLDRQVAAKYAYAYDNHRDVPPVRPNETPMQKLSREVAQRYLDNTVNWQRAWLAQRNKACAGGAVACLKQSYRAHLKLPVP